MWRSALIFLFVLSCAAATRADAQADFEANFAEEARKVQSTPQTIDDAAFARKLLDHANKLIDDPDGRAFFCIKAYEFSLHIPGGHVTADQAMTLLAKDPKQKPLADQKLLEMYESLYEAAKAKPQQRPFAERYVDVLVAVGEFRFGQGEMPDAAGLADTASKVVLAHGLRRGDVQALSAKVKSRMEIAGKLQKLRGELQQQPANPTIRLAIATLLIIELEQPKEAAQYLETPADQKEFAAVKLALRDPAQLDEEDSLALADWYKSQVNKASLLARPSVWRRARFCYERFLNLHPNKDAPRMRAQTAVAEINKLLPPETKKARVVDLLPMIDPQRDTARGTWTMKDGVLISDGTATMRIPYEPPEEYDFRIEFTRLTGRDAVGQSLSTPSSTFTWLMASHGNRVCGFERINGQRANEVGNPTHLIVDKVLENGRRYTSIVRVRKDGVVAEVEGRVLATYKGDFFEMTEGALGVGKGALGFGAWDSKTAFHVVQVTEITGEGKPSPRRR
jgi:hypothetical protein